MLDPPQPPESPALDRPEPPRAIPPETVDALLRLAGLPPPDPATLARISVGAANAFAALSGAGQPGFDDAPDGFVAELARLAADAD
jgi:hypothetical protein